MWSVIGRIVSAGSFFVSHFLLGRVLPKPEYAAYLTASAAVLFLIVFVSMGTAPILGRAVRQAIYGERAGQTQRIILSCWQLIFGSAIVVSLVFWGFTALLPAGTTWQVMADYPLLLSAWFSLTAGCLVTSWALQGLDDYRSAVIVGARNGGALPNFTFLLLVCLCYYRGVGDLLTLFVAQALLQAVSLLIGVWLVGRRLRRMEIAGLTGTSTETNSADGEGLTPGWFLRESWPNLAIRLINAALTRLDILWVGIFASELAVADYGACKILVTLVAAPFVMLLPTLGPFTAELLSKGQLQRLERILRGFATLVCLPVVGVLAVYMLLPGWTLSVTYGQDYVGASPLLQILCVGQLAFVLSGNNGQTLVMGGHQRSLMSRTLIMFLAYVIVALPLMWAFGVVGAAVALSLVTLVQSIIITLLAKKLVGVWTMATLSPKTIRSMLLSIFNRDRQGSSEGESSQNDAD